MYINIKYYIHPSEIGIGIDTRMPKKAAGLGGQVNKL